MRIRNLVTCGLFVAAICVAACQSPRASRAAEKGEFPADYFYNAPDDPDQQELNKLVGKKMPELAVSDWSNGEVKPADMKGKVVIVDLWATWCGPCVRAIPHNNEMYSKLKDKGLVVIGVCTDRGQEKLGEIITQQKIAYPVCKDADLKTGNAYNVKFYPTYVAVDRKGIVRAIGLAPEKVEEVVKKLLEEKAK